MNSNPSIPEDDSSINIFFEGMQVFRSRWNVLNERCKKLESALQEAIIEKQQLQVKLTLSRDYTEKIEKEKEELAIVVKDLHNDLQQNLLLKWIETLGEKISVLNKSTSEIVNPRVIDDITLLSSDDESDALPNNDEKTDESRRKESRTFRSIPNSTTPDVSDLDYSSPSSTTPNQTTASAGSEVSVLDTTVSIENSLRRDSNEEQSLNDTRNVCSDEISRVDVPVSSRSTPSIENNKPSVNIAQGTTTGDFISENESLLSQEFTPSTVEKSSSSAQKEHRLDTSHDFLVGAQPSPKPLPERMSPKKNGMSPEIQSITLPENLLPLNVQESEPIAETSKTPPQINGEELESTTNKREIISNIENSEINVNTPDPPQLTSIADVETSMNEKQSTDSARSPPPLIEYSSECIPITNNEIRVEDDIEITVCSRDATGDMQQAVESFHSHFLDARSEILDKNGIDFHVSMSNHQHVQFANEALLQQGVIHEEIHPAEETLSENVSDTESCEEPENASTFEIPNQKGNTMNGENSIACEITNRESDVIKSGEKSTNQGVTPEELICQIFGSPMTSTEHDSEVICLPNEPNCVIDLNLSDEESSDTGKPSASIAKPELTVNLPRILPAKFKVTKESVYTSISYLTSETKPTEKVQNDVSNSKRSCSPSLSELEPKAKRSSPSKSTELEDSIVSQEKKIIKCLLCKDIDKEFECYSALDVHIIAEHPNPYPYYFRCHYGRGNCKRHFRTTKKVNDHVRRRHLGEDLSLTVEKLYPGQKPWRCSICDKIFAHSSHLRGHLRHTHNVTETEGLAKYEFKMHARKVKRRTISKSTKNGYSVGECVICLNDEGSSEKFKTYQDLDEHIFRIHPNPYPFYLRCPFCKNENVRHFKGLSWLNNHIQNNHSSKSSLGSDN